MRHPGLVPGNHFYSPPFPPPEGFHPEGNHLSVDVSHLRSRLSSVSPVGSAEKKIPAHPGHGLRRPDPGRGIYNRQLSAQTKNLSLGLRTGPMEYRPGHPTGLSSLLDGHGASHGAGLWLYGPQCQFSGAGCAAWLNRDFCAAKSAAKHWQRCAFPNTCGCCVSPSVILFCIYCSSFMTFFSPHPDPGYRRRRC